MQQQNDPNDPFQWKRNFNIAYNALSHPPAGRRGAVADGVGAAGPGRALRPRPGADGAVGGLQPRPADVGVARDVADLLRRPPRRNAVAVGHGGEAARLVRRLPVRHDRASAGRRMRRSSWSSRCWWGDWAARRTGGTTASISRPTGCPTSCWPGPSRCRSSKWSSRRSGSGGAGDAGRAAGAGGGDAGFPAESTGISEGGLLPVLRESVHGRNSPTDRQRKEDSARGVFCQSKGR